MMMYQLPIDMMTRIASVILATMSPPFQQRLEAVGVVDDFGAPSPLAAFARRRRGARRGAGGRGGGRGGGRCLRLRRLRDDRGGRRR